MGKCPGLQQLDSFAEERPSRRWPRGQSLGANRGGFLAVPDGAVASAASAPVPHRAVSAGEEIRLSTGIGEFDRVCLGEGLWQGRLC